MAGCATTEQARHARPSGFLEDYSQLEPGRGDQALLLYINPAADFSGYKAVVVEPVTIWAGEGTALEDVPQEDLQGLADYLDAALREQLAHEFEIVDGPRAGALRIRTALTDAKGSRVSLDVASTVLPPALLLSQLKKLATGTHAFVGRAGIEIEILDAQSGERLVAAVDERAGGKTLRGSSESWSHVKAAFDYWAEVLRMRLAAFRDYDAAQASTP